VVQVKFAKPTTAEEARRLVTAAGEPDAVVAGLGKEGLEYLITAQTHMETKSTDSLPQRLVKQAGAGNLTIQQVDIVGPKVGAELKLAAIRSLLYSVLLITIYIWMRFDLKFAPGATVAMVHDIIIVAGYYMLFGKEFTITAVAALLTIAGYSVNDTIVIYDRVREILKNVGGGADLRSAINKAINVTLSRTTLTSGVTMISIIPIAIFCTGEIKDFAEAMLIGILVGTYSTIYVAAPLTVYVQRFLEKDEPKKRKVGKPVPT
jgi:preprotein translocase subunit SecF